jgi:hypothetical protein
MHGSPNVVPGRLCIRRGEVREDLNEVESATRAERRHRRRVRHLRWLMIVAVLVALCFATVVYAGVVREGSGSAAGHSAVGAGEVHSPGVDPEEGHEPTSPSAEKARLLASKAAQGLVAKRSGGPTHEPADKQVPEDAQKATEESLESLLNGAKGRTFGRLAPSKYAPANPSS